MNSILDKCAKCGKSRGSHRALGASCPIGRRDRTGGYARYSLTEGFTPKVPGVSVRTTQEARNQALVIRFKKAVAELDQVRAELSEINTEAEILALTLTL